MNDDLTRKVDEDSVDEDLRARNRQQSAVAALGQTAIAARDLTTLLDEAAAVAAETLDTAYSAVLELLADGERLLVRAGVGWKEGLVGHQTVPAGMGSSAGFVLRSDAPVVIADVRRETRFAKPPALLDHGVVSTMGVIIRGRARLWGVLAVYATRPRSFSANDVGFLQSVANVLALAMERHELELSQRKEKETLQAIFDNIPVMISSYDACGRLLRVNREWERTLGWTLEEAQRIDILAEVYPDPEYRRKALSFIQRAERRCWADFRLRNRAGRFMDVSWTRFELSDGSRMSFGVDITERKQAEEALAESEARFAKIFQASPVALGMSTIVEGRIIDVNESWLELFGYRRDEVVGRTVGELGLAADQACDATVRQYRTEGVARNVERQARRKTGEIRDLIVSVVPVDLRGKTESCISAQVDITDRKRAEAERDRLLESETEARAEAEAALEKLRAIESITDSALHHLALDELLRELLARLRRALDTDSAAVLLLHEDGQTLYPRAVDGQVHERVASIRVRVGTGVTGTIAAEGRPLIVDDYSTIDVSGIQGVPPSDIRAMVRSVMGVPLRIGDKIVGVVAVSSSRPRRFTEEELKLLLLVAARVAPAIELRRLVERVRAGRERQKVLARRLLTAQEEERRRLAVELHDELGQVLTAVKINLASLERQSGAAPASTHLRDAIGSVDSAMERVRDLALDLRPSVLDDLGLPAALRCYVDRFARAARVEAHLSIDAVPHLEAELQTACFRVAQEALTNVARHAQARHVWLDLHFVAEGLELKVRDDGIGFDVGSARERAIGGASMGLLGMQERVSLLGGAYEVLAAPGCGTEVRARFPMGEKVRSTA